MIKHLLSLFILFFLLSSCKIQRDGPFLPSEDPNSFSADFKIYEVFNNGFKVATDTIVKFSALMKSDEVFSEYKWQVGNTEYFSRDLYLQFGQEDLNGPIPVTLFATKNFRVNGTLVTKLFTVKRMLTIKTLEKSSLSNVVDSQMTVKSPYFGHFQGAFMDNPVDIFTVIIANHGINPVPANTTEFWDARIYNLPKGCGGKIQKGNCNIITDADVSGRFYAPSVDPGYLGFVATGGSNAPGYCCPEISMKGMIINEAQDSIRIECKIKIAGGAEENRVFIGKKL